MASTSMEKPSVSDRRMNSCRFVIAHLSGAGQEIDGVVPFALAQIHILGKGMQMPHQRAITSARRGLMSLPMRLLTAFSEFSSVKKSIAAVCHDASSLCGAVQEGAEHPGELALRVLRHVLGPPGDMLVGAHQHAAGLVDSRARAQSPVMIDDRPARGR
jgi:hypothetical protein